MTLRATMYLLFTSRARYTLPNLPRPSFLPISKSSSDHCFWTMFVVVVVTPGLEAGAVVVMEGALGLRMEVRGREDMGGCMLSPRIKPLWHNGKINQEITAVKKA